MPQDKDRNSELISAERVRHVDSLYWSPEERANGIHGLVVEMVAEYHEWARMQNPPKEEISDLDIFYYCVGKIAAYSLAIGNPELSNMAEALCRWMYTHHYQGAELIYDKPNKRHAQKGGEVN